MRRRIAILVVMLVVLISVGGAIWISLSRAQAKQPALAMPDGSELRLVKITYGAKHEALYGDRWQDVLFQGLPVGLREKLNCHVANITTLDTNAVVVWLGRNNIPPTPPTGNDEVLA